jgi:hypothetical protein
MGGSEKISDQEFAEWIKEVEGDGKKNNGTTRDHAPPPTGKPKPAEDDDKAPPREPQRAA